MQNHPFAIVASAIAVASCVICSGASAGSSAAGDAAPIVWQLESVSRIGSYDTTVLGSPRVVREGEAHAICFDGETDAILLPGNPIEGWAEFTVEALIKPDATGPEEQRFLHIQDERESRLLLETRLTPEGTWALDTFLFVPPDARLTLLDRTKLHPAERWQWVALVFDRETMTHYVNRKKELEGKIPFQPMKDGQMSIGVRLNQVSWYKGCIREIRFTPRALQEGLLQ